MRREECRWIREKKPELEDLAKVSHLPLTGFTTTQKEHKRCGKLRGEHTHTEVFIEHSVSTPWLLMLLGYMGTNHQCGTDRMFKAMHMLESLVMPAVAKLDNKQQTKEKQKTERNNRK